jgi:hypothetical protein
LKLQRNFWLSAVVAYVVSLTLTGCYRNPNALPFVNKTYTGKYEQKQGDKSSQTIVSADGKGHVRIEAPKAAFLHDYTNGKNYMINDDKRLVLWTALTDTNGWIYNGEWFKTLPGVKDAGERKMEGHEAHGYIQTPNQSAAALEKSARVNSEEEVPTTVELWFDKETGALVWGQSRSAKSTNWTTKVLQLDKKPISAIGLRLPGNYKVQQMDQEHP